MFQDSWLEEEDFNSWLRKVKDDKAKYHCIVFNKKLSLSTSGRCALAEHPLGNKHIKNVRKRDNFFKPLTKHNEKCSSEKECSQSTMVPFPKKHLPNSHVPSKHKTQIL